MMESDQDDAINLLSLDGGGVRGVSSLLIVHEIMLKIKERHGLAEIPKPCDVFHMIAGTSTGGLIAIMLGRLRMSTEEALRQYDVCAAKIFSSKKWVNMTEKFYSSPMREVIQSIVKEKNLGEMMRDPTEPSKGKAVVCVMPRNRATPRNVRRIRSFTPAKDDWDKDIKIWEAARATTAATLYFKPQPLTTKDGTLTEDYIDAAFGVNNPVNELIKEAIAEFGPRRRLGCLVSIGTGTKRERGLSRAASGLKNVYDVWGSLLNIGLAMKDMVTSSELVHLELEGRLAKRLDAYFRFNVPNAADKVKLHYYSKMEKLKLMTNDYLSNSEVTSQIERVADILETENSEHRLNLGALAEPDATRPDENMKANLMSEASRYFTGRNDIIRILDSFFSDREGQIVPRREFCLHGLGGVGKTQIALKAANIFRHGDPQIGIPKKRRFKHILYVDGTDRTTISQSYASIAREEFDIEASGNSEQLMRRALQRLERLDDDWFLIYDNCNQEDRRALLPRGDTGNVLFTTRNRVVRNQMRPECAYDVEVLEELDAIRLLLTASGPKYADLNAWDQSIGAEIVKELGCLPLAIDQAAAYIREAPCPLDGYLEIFRKQRVELLQNPKFKGSLAQNQAVYTTFETSYKAIIQLEAHNKNLLGRNAGLALRALDVICFWQNENIPTQAAWWGGISWKHRLYMGKDVPALDEHLGRLTGDETMTWRKFFFQLSETGDGEFPSALEILERYSIITLKEGRRLASMHVLVHSWARDRMTDEHRARQALTSKVLLLDSIGDNYYTTWSRAYLHLVYPHVRACLKHSSWGAESIHLPYEVFLRAKYAYILTFQKHFGEAEAEYLQILHLGKVFIGPFTWAVLRTLNSLGKLYHEMGRLREAELTYLECIDRCEWERKSQQEEAEKHAKAQLADLRAVRKRKKNKKDGSDGDRPPTPEPPTEEEAAQAARSFVPDWNSTDSRQLQISGIEENLARVYYDMANQPEDLAYCEEFLTKALNRRKKILHPDNMDLWRTEDEYRRKTQLRDVQYWQFRLESAMKTFKSEEDELAFLTGDYRGRLIQSTADSMVAMRRRIRYAKGDAYGTDLDWLWEQAYKYYGIILWTGFIKWFGESDYRCLEIMRWMVECLIGLKRYEEAEALARRCLTSSIVGYGECHQETILSMEKLHEAIVGRMEKRCDLEAVYIIKDALFRADAVFGLKHRLTKRMHKKLVWAVENYQADLSNWAPTGQNVLTDALWEYGAIEDQTTRIALLGERAKYHDVSYTIPDPAFDKWLRKMTAGKERDVLEEMIVQNEPETTDTGRYEATFDEITTSYQPPPEGTSEFHQSGSKYKAIKSYLDSYAPTPSSKVHQEREMSDDDSSSGDPGPSGVGDVVGKGKSVAT